MVMMSAMMYINPVLSLILLPFTHGSKRTGAIENFTVDLSPIMQADGEANKVSSLTKYLIANNTAFQLGIAKASDVNSVDTPTVTETEKYSLTLDNKFPNLRAMVGQQLLQSVTPRCRSNFQ